MPVRAQPEGDEAARAKAKEKLDEGSARYGRGEFEGALQLYREAHELYASPKLYFNLGLASHKLGRNADAVVYFRRFLAEAIGAAREPRTEAERLLAELQPRVGWVEVTADAENAAVIIDGKPQGMTPLSATPLDPGAHTIEVQHPPSPPATEPIEIRAGEKLRLRIHIPATIADRPAPSLELKPAPPEPSVVMGPPSGEPAPAPGPRPFYTRWWFWTAVGVVVVGGAAAFTATHYPTYRQGSLGTEHASGF